MADGFNNVGTASKLLQQRRYRGLLIDIVNEVALAEQ